MNTMKSVNFTTLKGRQIAISQLGFGGAPLGNLYRARTEEEAQQTLQAAWDSGIRYFDTAPQYGHGLSEMRMGEFFSQKPRDEFVISSKIGRLLIPCEPGEQNAGAFQDTPANRIEYDYSYDGVMRSYEQSLARLKLDRIDILYIHDVDVFTHGSQAASDQRVDEVMNGGYRALSELRDNGDIDAIGVGVNEWQVCEKLLALGDFDLFLLAGRYTLLEQESLKSFLPKCQKRGSGIILGGPYNSGILATGATNNAMYNYQPATDEIKQQVNAIDAVCREFAVSLPQAALHFPLGHPSVISVIPGGQLASEVIRNVETFAKPVPIEFWQALKSQGLIDQNAPLP